MIKIVTDTSALRKSIPTTTFTKEEQDLATAALLTAVTQHQGLGIGQSFLKLGGELFDSHGLSRHCCDELHFGLPRLFSSGAKVKQAPRA